MSCEGMLAGTDVGVQDGDVIVHQRKSGIGMQLRRGRLGCWRILSREGSWVLMPSRPRTMVQYVNIFD